MENRLSRLESLLEELVEDLRRVERRLDHVESRLESGVERSTLSAPAEEPAPAGAEPRPRRTEVVGILPILGRTLVILAGAYLLRAITEGGLLPQAVGIILGMAYALGWIALAERAGGRGRRDYAAFYGLAGVVIGSPLLWEATVRYGFLPPPASAAATAAATGLVLAVAWHRELRGLAWVAVLAGLFVVLGLAAKTSSFIPYSVFLLLLGLLSLWIGYSRHWYGLSWSVAFVVDMVLFLLAGLLLLVPDPMTRFGLGPRSVMAVQLAAVLVYPGSFAVRTLLRRRDITLLGIVQTLAVVSVGLGGAIVVARAKGVGLEPLGAFCIVLAATCYGVAFTVIDRRLGRRRNFLFYSSLGIVFAVIGSGVLLPGRVLAVVFAVLGLITAWLGGRYSRVTLNVHSTVYLVAASLLSGLLASGAEPFLGTDAEFRRWLDPVLLLVLVSVGAAICLPAARHGRTWGRLSRGPKVLLYAAGLLGVGGAVVAALQNLILGAEGARADPGAVASIRTGVLAVSAVFLAWLGRRERFQEAGWLAYPVLILGGFKFLFEEIPSGRAVTLFLSLTLYGGALILVPRLRRGTASREG